MLFSSIESLEPLSLSMDMIEHEKLEMDDNQQVTKKKRKKNKSADVKNETKNDVPNEEEPVVAKKKKSKKEKLDNDLTKNSESVKNDVNSEKKKKNKKNKEVKEIETKSSDEILETSPPVLTTPTASFNKWESSNLGNSAANEKFRRLMGIKNTSTDVPKTDANNSGWL